MQARRSQPSRDKSLDAGFVSGCDQPTSCLLASIECKPSYQPASTRPPKWGISTSLSLSNNSEFIKLQSSPKPKCTRRTPWRWQCQSPTLHTKLVRLQCDPRLWRMIDASLLKESPGTLSAQLERSNKADVQGTRRMTYCKGYEGESHWQFNAQFPTKPYIFTESFPQWLQLRTNLPLICHRCRFYIESKASKASIPQATMFFPLFFRRQHSSNILPMTRTCDNSIAKVSNT